MGNIIKNYEEKVLDLKLEALKEAKESYLDRIVVIPINEDIEFNNIEELKHKILDCASPERSFHNFFQIAKVNDIVINNRFGSLLTLRAKKLFTIQLANVGEWGRHRTVLHYSYNSHVSGFGFKDQIGYFTTQDISGLCEFLKQVTDLTSNNLKEYRLYTEKCNLNSCARLIDSSTSLSSNHTTNEEFINLLERDLTNFIKSEEQCC